MPIRLANAVTGTNAASSFAGRLVAQEDAALVAGAKTGNARAFELLVQQLERKIFLLAQRVTQHGSPSTRHLCCYAGSIGRVRYQSRNHLPRTKLRCPGHSGLGPEPRG